MIWGNINKHEYPVSVRIQEKPEEKNSYFYIDKQTFKIMCEVYYRAKRDKKEAT